jgi:hypothetical protein
MTLRRPAGSKSLGRAAVASLALGAVIAVVVLGMRAQAYTKAVSGWSVSYRGAAIGDPAAVELTLKNIPPSTLRLLGREIDCKDGCFSVEVPRASIPTGTSKLVVEMTHQGNRIEQTFDLTRPAEPPKLKLRATSVDLNQSTVNCLLQVAAQTERADLVLKGGKLWIQVDGQAGDVLALEGLPAVRGGESIAIPLTKLLSYLALSTAGGDLISSFGLEIPGTATSADGVEQHANFSCSPTQFAMTAFFEALERRGLPGLASEAPKAATLWRMDNTMRVVGESVSTLSEIARVAQTKTQTASLADCGPYGEYSYYGYGFGGGIVAHRTVENYTVTVRDINSGKVVGKRYFPATPPSCPYSVSVYRGQTSTSLSASPDSSVISNWIDSIR